MKIIISLFLTFFISNFTVKLILNKLDLPSNPLEDNFVFSWFTDAACVWVFSLLGLITIGYVNFELKQYPCVQRRKISASVLPYH